MNVTAANESDSVAGRGVDVISHELTLGGASDTIATHCAADAR
jgi:hypothetical protein